jgi:hypothetical protein
MILFLPSNNAMAVGAQQQEIAHVNRPVHPYFLPSVSTIDLGFECSINVVDVQDTNIIKPTLSALTTKCCDNLHFALPYLGSVRGAAVLVPVGFAALRRAKPRSACFATLPASVLGGESVIEIAFRRTIDVWVRLGCVERFAALWTGSIATVSGVVGRKARKPLLPRRPHLSGTATGAMYKNLSSGERLVTTRANVFHFSSPAYRIQQFMGGVKSMNCDDIAVLEVWHLDERHDWKRHPDLEGPMDEAR